jgi:hypothetical protein
MRHPRALHTHATNASPRRNAPLCAAAKGVLVSSVSKTPPSPTLSCHIELPISVDCPARRALHDSTS